MNPCRVERSRTHKLTDLPNVGPAIARLLTSIEVDSPGDLVGKDPFELYLALGSKSGRRLDPCVLDICMSITDFMDGREPRVWWDFTSERKKQYGDIL